MQFLFPTFLWALLALAVPIIIHLFHFRRFKKVYFTNVHLLKEIRDETSSRSKLRNLLVLLARLLALAMLVLAFAQPILTDNDKNTMADRLITIFVDNSFSMNATKNDVPLLTIAKDKASDLVTSFSESDKFLVLTHDLETKHQRLVDQKTASSFISEIRPTANVKTIENILQLSARLGNREEQLQKSTYLISDFQRNIADFSEKTDSSVQIYLVPIRSLQENNVSIDDCYFLAPVPMLDVANRLVVKLTNNGNLEEQVQLSMIYQNQERPLGMITIAANSSSYDTIALSINQSGWHELELKIDDYPVQFDDHLFATFEMKNVINILNIFESEENEYLASAFESTGYYDLEQIRRQSVRYDQFKDQQLIITNDLNDLSTGLISELITYAEEGGNLLIFPSVNANLDSYNALLDGLSTDRLSDKTDLVKQVSNINSDEFIFNDVFIKTSRAIRLPQATTSYGLSNIQSRNRDILLSYRDGSPYLIKRNIEKGHVYLCTSPMNINANDLVLNAEIFVPMLYKMAISSGIKKPLYYTIGEDQIIEFQNIESQNGGNYLVKGQTEFIPGIRQFGRNNYIDVSDQIQKAGFYTLLLNETTVGRFAFDYNRLESDVRFGDMEIIKDQIGQDVKIIDQTALANVGAYVREKNEGIRLWRWCIMAALLFLLLETALLRFWK